VHLIGNHWKRISEIMTLIFGLRERVVIKQRAKMFMDNQANLALMESMAIIPGEEEASVQPEEAVVQLEEFFQGPPFPVERMSKIQSIREQENLDSIYLNLLWNKQSEVVFSPREFERGLNIIFNSS
jgi:hypothetical protein